LAVEKAFSVFDTIFIMDDHELCEIKICTSFIISPLRRANGEITCRQMRCPLFKNAAISGQVY